MMERPVQPVVRRAVVSGLRNMLERFGLVIGWTCNTVAILIVLFGTFVIWNGGDPPSTLVILGIPVVGIFLAGCAIRFIFTPPAVSSYRRL